MSEKWAIGGCVLIALVLVAGLVALVIVLPWWVSVSAFGVLLLLAAWYDWKHPGIARQLKRHMNTWDPEVQLVVLLSIAHLPHGSRDSVELLVGRETGTAKRTHLPGSASTAEQEVCGELKLSAEHVSELHGTMQSLSAWEFEDQRFPMMDGTVATLGFTDGKRMHRFSAQMPHGPQLRLIQQVIALAPLAGIEDVVLAWPESGLLTELGLRDGDADHD